ncbi:ACP S-malonyltransferase [Thiohalomonas denitrificans]|uniref:Malonyl CoA-acyl carrier protein transacylase n=1 Tax=Thiohalomonas denitrificans TaxID=415747 RepID=A0A1G5QBA0_9GAMM|nr:ACP S-malonyltransferase [Thiohalomonas denitrificans]SCZ58942.1 [acyl-carrier-protein] S-malonyltransferase [Thiohalomonas denitrificans]
MSLAFVFPGQGSQAIGMLGELAADHPRVSETFAVASQVLGYDLWQIVAEGPADKLNQTHITQPAMLAAGVATWRVWKAEGGADPAMMAGHSLGEYSALVCSGSLDFEQAVSLVADRGRFMQEAVPAGVGAMAAILGLEDDKVIDVCRQAAQDKVVAAVNFNSPGQVVVAGHIGAVERAVGLAKEAGAKRAMLLPVSVPSHCELMMPAAVRMKERLAGVDIKPPAIPVINNTDVAAPSDPNAIRDALVRQLHSPVHWVESVRRMIDDGADVLVECGPGKVLTGLTKRIERRMTALPLYDSETLAKAKEALG